MSAVEGAAPVALGAATREAYVEVDRKPEQSQAYIFISVDLVNSTARKELDGQWPVEMQRFYLSAHDAFERGRREQSLLRPRVWKYAGDEVLFYVEVFSSTEVLEAVQLAERAVRLLQEQFSKDQGSAPRARRLGVKGTCWIALASERSPSPNVIIRTPHVPGRDFLGPDIDTGFRLGQAAIRGTLVLSAEVALIMHAASADIRKMIRLAGYRELKGIWQGRPYPVYLYRNSWESLDSDFDYDEFLSSEYLAAASKAVPFDADDLRRILHQVDKSPDVVETHLTLSQRPTPTDLALQPELEVHVAAACVSTASRKVMMRLRTSGGAWDFGCVPLLPDVDLEQLLREAYFQKFNVRLQFDAANQGAVLSRYSFRRDGRSINGFVVPAWLEPGSEEVQEYSGRQMGWFPFDQDPPQPSVADAAAVFDGLRTLVPRAVDG